MNRQEQLAHGQELSEDFLAHYGVPGMKWGTRRARGAINKTFRSERKSLKKEKRALLKQDIKDTVGGVKRNIKTNTKAMVTRRRGDSGRKMTMRKQGDHLQTLQKKLDSQKKRISISEREQASYDKKRAAKKALRHGETVASNFLLEHGSLKSKGGVSHDNNDTLAHYGVPGMKWGVRKSGSSSRKTVRTAKKDAKRHMDAKMFYGKTAGTKRKLLKAEVTQKKKNMPGYEKEFEKALANVDQAKSARKATRTRKRKDAAYRTRVTTKQALGVTGPLTVAAGFAVANNPELRRKVTTTGKHLGKKITSKLTHGEELSEDFLAHYGVLGMKWGKRKGSSGSSIKSSKKSKKNPKASTLSDAELRQRINRLQMEKQYKQLTTKDRSTASKFVGDVVRESAKQTASSYVTKYMKTGVDAGIGAAKKSKTYGKGRTLAGNAKRMIKKRKGS